MQSLNIVLTKHYIYYQSFDLPLEETLLETSLDSQISNLSNLLAELSLPRGTQIRLILDRSYTSYFYFRLPTTSKRRLDRMLKFELEDVLIEDVDAFYYDYHTQKIDDETLAGVFLVKKNLADECIQIAKSHNLDLRSILSLEDLVEHRLRALYHPENEFVISADRFTASVFAYKNGFPIAYSSQTIPDQIDSSVQQGSESENCADLAEINWKLRAIRLQESEVNSIRLSNDCETFISVDDRNNLIVRPKDRNGVPHTICSPVLSDLHSRKSKHIDLLKTDFFLLQEIRKHTKKSIILGVLLLCWGLLYLSSLIYQNIENSQRFNELQETYRNTVKQYLPSEPPPDDALAILRREVADLKEQYSENQRFGQRDYRISKQLNEISGIKNQIASLSLSRFFLTDQSIRIQGNVATFAEYDLLKASLQKIYSKSFTIRFNQNSVGDNRIEFTVTIRPI